MPAIHSHRKRGVFRRESCVYFIEVPGFIKIGWSGDWQKRVAEIQGSNPTPIKVLLVVKGSVIDEKNLHERFAEHRSVGEWFRDHPDIRSYIDIVGRYGERLLWIETIQDNLPTLSCTVESRGL